MLDKANYVKTFSISQYDGQQLSVISIYIDVCAKKLEPTP